MSNPKGGTAWAAPPITPWAHQGRDIYDANNHFVARTGNQATAALIVQIINGVVYAQGKKRP